MNKVNLSEEQQNFINNALTGHNVLVDACIGSGKTTAIQELCNQIPQNKSILYLTYNKLLKADARDKIRNSNVKVHNYHSFALKMISSIGVKANVNEYIQTFLITRPPIPHYDVLILDEYQDINEEISKELLYIKDQCPGIQIIAVGDLCQKIYDYTTLKDISGFIHELLDNPVEISFTKCFRLPKKYAATLGRIWHKTIDGVNDNCSIEHMSLNEAVEYLGSKNPEDVLCLGSSTSRGNRIKLQNNLERVYPAIYNKNTLWSSITEDGRSNSTEPKKDSAIFTTFDGSKGMERPICVICDFDSGYWEIRQRKPFVKYNILRNIFLVAASRGKNEVIFINDEISKGLPLTEEILSKPFETITDFRDPINISSAFDYKYKEDVEKAYNMLSVEKVQNAEESIDIPLSDGLIDISPCIGEFVEASYFDNYDIDSQMKFLHQFSDRKELINHNLDVQKQILQLTVQDTGQWRYIQQVYTPYVDQDAERKIHSRLATRLPKNVNEQVDCGITFSDKDNGDCTLELNGRCDAIKDGCIYELKFVNELAHTHFLQIACYLVAMDKQVGYLWNIRNNEMYKVSVPDKKQFLNQVAITVTKRVYDGYHAPMKKKYFAVVDIETNQCHGINIGGIIDGNMMSIGLVIAEENTFAIQEKYYGIEALESQKQAWQPAHDSLRIPDIYINREGMRKEIISDIRHILDKYNIKHIYAYNCSFDRDHLDEFRNYEWVDIMTLCSYRQFNPYLPLYLNTCKTGRVRRGYKVDDILKYINDPDHLDETHNALCDAEDELFIMKKMKQPLSMYKEIEKENDNDKKKEYSAISLEIECRRADQISKMNAELEQNILFKTDSLNDTWSNRQQLLLYGWVDDMHEETFFEEKVNAFTIHNSTGARKCLAEQYDYNKTYYLLKDYSFVIVEAFYYQTKSRHDVRVKYIYTLDDYKTIQAKYLQYGKLTTDKIHHLKGLKSTVVAVLNGKQMFMLATKYGCVRCAIGYADRELTISEGDILQIKSGYIYKSSIDDFYVVTDGVTTKYNNSNEKNSQSSVSNKTTTPKLSAKTNQATVIEGHIADIRVLRQEIVIRTSSNEKIICKYTSSISGTDKEDVRKGIYLAFSGQYKGKK